MRVLGLDTSTMTGGVCLLQEGRLVAESLQSLERRTHSERLMPVLLSVLDQAGWQVEDLQGIAVAVGPGSFTGLRIGVTTAKALAYALQIPLVGVGTLHALSVQVRGLSAPVLDARRGQVYTGLYRDGQEILSPLAIDLNEFLQGLPPEPVTFIGDGLGIHRGQIQETLGERARFLPGVQEILRPASVAYLGWERLREGESHDPLTLIPEYLRASEAEIRHQGGDL